MRTPMVLQMEAVECGAAALAIVLAHHGRIVPLAALRRECGVTRDGSKASNICKAARRHGLVAKGFKRTLEGLRDVALPAVLFWNFNHFVVLEGFVGGRCAINDPAGGHRTVSLAELDECFTGVVLVFEPSPDFRPGGRRPSLLPALRRNLRGAWPALLFCVLAGLLLVAPNLVLPFLVQVFIDQVFVRGRAEWLPLLLGALAVVAVLETALTVLELRHLRELRIKLSTSMSSRFLWHVLRLPASYFAQRYAAEIAGRVALNDGVAGVLSGQLARAGIDAVMLVFYGAVMMAYDPVLTGAGVLAVLADLLCLRALAGRRAEASRRVLLEEGKLGGIAIGGLASIETLKASAQENAFFARWAGLFTKASNARQEMEAQGLALQALPGVMHALLGVLIVVLGGWRVIHGSMSIGMLFAFQLLMAHFEAPLRTLLGLGAAAQGARVDLERLDDVLASEADPIAQARDALAPRADDQPARLAGRVTFEGVSFGFSPIDPPLIQGLDLAIEPGQRVALVGGSGSGKSTIARLVVGVHAPTAGVVRLDGRRLEELPRDVAASSLAFVEQELFFFAGTVRENLSLWDETVPEEALLRACRDAEVLDVVRALPGGLDAWLLEGARNLSGGQRQRLELARALVNDPSVLVLDEATSALDPETEHRIDQNLRRRGCTCVIVAHRLSTIRDCDEILVLEQGKVVQRGRHDALWAAGGAYADLLAAGEGAVPLEPGAAT